MPALLKTLSVRVRDKHAKLLSQMAYECNQVWNAANALSAEFSRVPIPGVGWVRGHTSAFDIQKELKGLRGERGFAIHSSTAQEVIAVHAKACRQFGRDKLRWRVSEGPRRSLGWVPFKSGAAKWANGQVRYAGSHFKVWDSYGLSDYAFRAGSFSEDARGRWYFNIVVEVVAECSEGVKAIGVDPGIKHAAVCSDGSRLDTVAPYRELETKLGLAQRAGKKARVRAIHAKIRNRRKEALHQFSTALVKRSGAIFVGDVSSPSLAKTRMAKSVRDAGWGLLRTQLEYKALARSVVFEVVDEKYTTQACSRCGEISPSSPKGRAGLRIREWTCAGCGAAHDRDVNAARNILAAGLRRLEAGILAS